jgi:hypothetical protein
MKKYGRNIKEQKQKRRFLINGVVLSAITVFLAVVFTINHQWNGGSIAVIIITSLIASFQFFIYFQFFSNKKQ